MEIPFCKSRVTSRVTSVLVAPLRSDGVQPLSSCTSPTNRHMERHGELHSVTSLWRQNIKKRNLISISNLPCQRSNTTGRSENLSMQLLETPLHGRNACIEINTLVIILTQTIHRGGGSSRKMAAAPEKSCVLLEGEKQHSIENTH